MGLMTISLFFIYIFLFQKSRQEFIIEKKKNYACIAY